MPDKVSANNSKHWIRLVIFWVTALSLAWYSVYMCAAAWEKGRTWYEESLSAPVSSNVFELLLFEFEFFNGTSNQEPLMYLCKNIHRS